ncbi:MAG: AarF/UbiB family protein [Pirellula sp.]
MAILWRLLHIVAVLVSHGSRHGIDILVEAVPCIGRLIVRSKLTKPERLKLVFESLGGSFVKLGQMLALQPDILPFEYCHALYSLLDRVKPIPSDEIEAVFVQEIGKTPLEIFDRFDRIPIASGSIGQVHVATMAGRKIAVKIQRPDTLEGFERDIQLMKAAVWIILKFRLSVLSWMVDPLTEFVAWTVEELDFRNEARYMIQLRRNADENMRERVPYVEPMYIRKRVLLIEFFEGVTLLDHIRMLEKKDAGHTIFLNSLGFDPDEFARAIIDNFLGDAFRHGMFHADLHPANLMILPKNVVGYIDFGITGVISQFSRQNLVAMTLAYARRDIESLCDRFFDLSSMDERSKPERFREGAKRLSEKWYKGDENNPTLKTSTTMVMLDMLKLSRETHIWPQRDVIKYIRSAIAIDGLIRQFAPHFDVGSHLAVACRRYLSWHARKALFSQDAVVNWSQATTQLIQNGAFRFSTLLERVGSDRGSRTSDSGDSRRKKQSARHLLFVACGAGMLAFTSHDKSQFGLNLFSAQVLVSGIALVAFWKTLATSNSRVANA